MKKLSQELTAFQRDFQKGPDDMARIAYRASQVQQEFKEAIEHLYREHAPLVLSHVNAVYILDGNPAEDGAIRKGIRTQSRQKQSSPEKTLVVYLDDGSFRADIHSQQHFIMLWLNERYGEGIEHFKAYPSRMGMRKKHPYGTDDRSDSEPRYGTWLHGGDAGPRLRPEEVLSAEELRRIDDQSARIENERLKTAYRKAALADQAWKKHQAQ